jgi:glycerol-3-phosphate acyltransferase PlsY
VPAASVALAYLVGSVPFAWLLARWWGVTDLHAVGSGNLGATNVLRTAGTTAGVLVALLDIAKGAAGVWIARRLGGSNATSAAAGVAAILGHVYPVWLHFRGGKGVATATGAFAVLTPLALAPAVLVFAAVVSVTKYISLGSVLAAVTLPASAYVLDSPRSSVVASVVAALLIVFRHRSNLARLVSGTERRLGARS